MDISNALVNEVIGVFENSYANHGDFVVSCMFAHLGVYNIVQNTPRSIQDYAIHEETLHNIFSSYVWHHIHGISHLLKRSALHHVINSATSYIYVMDDSKLSKSLIYFKKDISAFMKRHAQFLAYCDVETTDFYTVVNGLYSLSNEEYDTNNEMACRELKQIFLRYKHNIPKVALLILDDIQEVIDVRKYTHGCLSFPTDFSHFPQLPKYQKQAFQNELLKFTHCDIQHIMKPLTRIYRQFVPFFVLSKMTWIFTNHGEKTTDMASIAEHMNKEAIDGIRVFKSFITSYAVSPMKKELQNMMLLRSVFDIIDDDFLFDNYSFEPIGWYALHTFRAINDFYQNNIKIIIVSDLIHTGFYNAVSGKFQLNADTLEKAIARFEHELVGLSKELNEYKSLQDVRETVLVNLEIVLKRVQRYLKYLRYVSDTDELPQYIDMIFGNVYDNDGSPYTCAICLDDAVEKHDCWFQLPCCHKFHLECVNTLIHSSVDAKCPLCRVEF